MKHKPGRKPLSPQSGGSRGTGLLDRLLVPRIENYAQNNSYTEVDEVTDFLRRSYKEYARKKTAQFKQQVARAIAIVQKKGGPQRPELQLQVRGKDNPSHTAAV